MSSNNNNKGFTSESITQKRIRNFKKIRRAYWSLGIIVGLYVLSFFSAFLVNNKALVVKYNGEFYFPAAADFFSFIKEPSHREGKDFNQNEVFGEPHYGEPNYRELKKSFKKKNNGNWVLMPPYPYNPIENLLGEFRLKNVKPPTAPDRKNVMGTDNQGRDVFARLVYGFRISISFALLVTILSYIIGIFVGGLLGYFGGKVDIFGLRFIEIFSMIPFLFMVMILSSFLKPSFTLLAFMLVVFGGWIGITYYVRGEFYREKSRDYTAAAIAMGAGTRRVMFKHILPNSLTPVITFAPFAIIRNISSLVALDFLGFGLRPPTPSWGEIIRQGVTEDISNWWLIVTPLVAIFLTLVTITFIGEGVRQAFDPREYSRLR